MKWGPFPGFTRIKQTISIKNLWVFFQFVSQPWNRPSQLCSLLSWRFSRADLITPEEPDLIADPAWSKSLGYRPPDVPFKINFSVIPQRDTSSHLQREEWSRRTSQHSSSHTSDADPRSLCFCSWKRALALPPPTCRLPQIPLSCTVSAHYLRAAIAISCCGHSTVNLLTEHDVCCGIPGYCWLFFFKSLTYYKILFLLGLRSGHCKEGLERAGIKWVITLL